MRTIRDFLNTVRSRWLNTMPKFFKNICLVGTLISGTAIAVNTAIVTAGGIAPEWWNVIYPYLVGVPAGAAFVAKFTQQYSGKPIENGQREPVTDKEPEPREIEPYDDRPDT